MVGELARLDTRPESVAQLAYAAIRDAIVAKTLPPGSSVSEANFARQLGVSKTPVRDALLRLQEVGLLEPDGNRGVRVVQPSRETVVQAYEVRWALEPAVAALAAMRASEDQREHLTYSAERSVDSAQARDSKGFRRWDWVFHEGASDAANSRRLAGLAKNALALSSVLRARDLPSSGDSMKCALQHVEIAEAITRRDETAARELAAQHVEDVLAIVLTTIANDHVLDVGTEG